MKMYIDSRVIEFFSRFGHRPQPTFWSTALCLVFVLLLSLPAAPRPASADTPAFETLVESAGPRDLNSIPSMCRLASGDILVVYHQLCCHMCFGIHDQPWVDHYQERLPELTTSCPLPNKGRLMGIRSSDDGESWSEPFVVSDGPFSESDPQVSVAPDGTVYLVHCIRRWYRKHNVIDQLPNHTPYPEYPRYIDTAIVTSSDGGRSWSEPEILPLFYEFRDSCHDPIQFLPDGTLMMAIQGNAYRGPESGMVLVSHRNRPRWTVRGVIAHPTESISEHALCQLGAGRLICAMRPGPFLSRSSDEGRSWSLPQKLPGGPEKAPYFLLTSKNELLLFESTRISGKGFTVRISRDMGETFTSPISIDRTAGNPHGQAVELRDGAILAVYGNEYGGSRADVRAVRFHVKGDDIVP